MPMSGTVTLDPREAIRTLLPRLLLACHQRHSKKRYDRCDNDNCKLMVDRKNACLH